MFEEKYNELIKGIEGYNPSPLPLEECPFLMTVEAVSQLWWSGSPAVRTSGYVERGKINVGDQVELPHFAEPLTLKINYIEFFRRSVSCANTGMRVDIISPEFKLDHVKIGQTFVYPGSATVSASAKVGLYLLGPSERGGKYEPITEGIRTTFKLRNFKATACLQFPPSAENGVMFPGDYLHQVELTILESCVMEIGDRFELTEGDQTLAIGVIEEVF